MIQSKLGLASTSRYRHALLSRLKIPFVAAPPACDETRLKQEFLTQHPQLDEHSCIRLAQMLSRHKAQSAGNAADIWIGSDQICFFKGKTLSKPGTPERAAATLRDLQGQTHSLVTSVTVWDGSRSIEWTTLAHLTMLPLSEEQIQRYIEIDQPLDCAGSYKLEAAGISLMRKIECEDWTAIEGLPLLRLNQVLKDFGF